MISSYFHVCSRLQPEPGATRGSRVPVRIQSRGEHFLPGGQLRPQPEPHLLRLHRDIEQHWSRTRLNCTSSVLLTSTCISIQLSHPLFTAVVDGTHSTACSAPVQVSDAWNQYDKAVPVWSD